LIPKKSKSKNAVLFKGGEKTVTYDNGETTTITYQPLDIASDQKFFDRTQGKHPVLHLSFKELCFDL
jgi:hypothetical protein